MPCDYKKYPKDWKERRARILVRAGNRCEKCKVYNYAVGYRDEDGRFIPNGGNRDCDASGIGEHPDGTPLTYAEAKEIADEYNCCDGTDEYDNHWIVIVLTIAHLKRGCAPGSPEEGELDCPDEDLAALCQRCHLRLDEKRHKAKREERREYLFPRLPGLEVTV